MTWYRLSLLWYKQGYNTRPRPCAHRAKKERRWLVVPTRHRFFRNDMRYTDQVCYGRYSARIGHPHGNQRVFYFSTHRRRVLPPFPVAVTQAFIPVAQGALSHGALHVVRPKLELAATRLLEALASTSPSTVLRNGRRFCRALVQVSKPHGLLYGLACADALLFNTNELASTT